MRGDVPMERTVTSKKALSPLEALARSAAYTSVTSSSRLLSVQMTFSSGFHNEMITDEDDSRALASTRPLEPLCREKRCRHVKVWPPRFRLLARW